MPTLAELANEVNNRLSQIETHTKEAADMVALVRGDAAELKAGVDVTNATVDAGLAFLGQGLFSVLEAQRMTNAKLATLVDRVEVMLGWAAKLADMMGRQVRALEQELASREDALAEPGSTTPHEPRARGWDGQWKREP
ncbi:hypothetical protein [Paraliomyxa miuraensis]|uniref:hypothetical protein n=1 Tax=Paraliomyxa miuraensis TaxID=376150 RepID=UPI002257F685|nr:hypothetical protein [Paraliomyxa miuraensis]MCX4239961.1 hypothetical protein [Paraliomyxa miuraensis]